MSRGFVKEEDQEEAPFIPPRSPLPAGVTNYVTPNGYQELIDEKNDLEAEFGNIKTEDEKEKRHARAVVTGKLNLLTERIALARIIDPKDQPQDEVRFGANVKFKNLNTNIELEFRLVGVDEADINKHKIAFLAPIAKALTGKKVGETTQAMMAGKIQDLEILEISYS